MPGDLVTAINGTPLDDPARGMEILQSINSASEVTVTVERNGQSAQVSINNAAGGRRGSGRGGGRDPVGRDAGRGSRSGARRGSRGADGVTMTQDAHPPDRGSGPGCALRRDRWRSRGRPRPWRQAEGTITPNYKDADLSQIIEAVSAVTGKNFIVDPRVRAQVTMLSSTPMTPAAFYEAFLSILQVHGFVAVASGDVVKIVPDANARQLPANDLPSSVSSTSDEIVTQVIAVRNVSAAQLVPILRPLIPQYGHLAAYPASNMLIISDRAANVSRMMRIIQRIDQSGDAEVDVIPMQHASATEVVRIVTSLYAGGGEGAGAPDRQDRRR